jgi:hypothetical protein
VVGVRFPLLTENGFFNNGFGQTNNVNRAFVTGSFDHSENPYKDPDTIDPTPRNTAPVAKAQSVTVPEDANVTITLSASDAEGDAITYTLLQAPQHGTLVASPDLVYTPNANYFGPDSFGFSASDGELLSTAIISIDVTPVNDAPIATIQAVHTSENTPVAITLSGSDAEGDALTFIIVNPPTRGVLSGTPPALTYTPGANLSGPDGFTFRVSDGTAQSAPAEVAIQVAEVNSPPVVAVPLADRLVQDASTLLAIDVAGAFTDTETPVAALVYSVVSADPLLANPTFEGSILRLQLDPNRSGSTNITVRATDAAGASVEDVFTVTVARPGVRVSVADTNRREGLGMAFTISLSAAVSSPVTVNYSTAPLSATAGVDFTPITGSVVILPGDLTRVVSVPTIQDVLDESDETFRFLLNSSSSGSVLEDAEAVGTIIDEDIAVFTVQDITIQEGDTGITKATFEIVLSNPMDRIATVNYATSSPTGSSATDGRDYFGRSGTLTFPVGNNVSQIVTIDILGDLLDEPNETFSFTLSDAVSATISRGNARATINDDDNPPVVSVADASIVEGNAGSRTIAFTLTLSGPSQNRTRVRYQTVDQSAVAGIGGDYGAVAGEAVFDPGVTTRTVSVVVFGDTLPEPGETFLLNLNTPSLLTIGDGEAVGTITNDD